jgi:chemotaxis protein CheX
MNSNNAAQSTFKLSPVLDLNEASVLQSKLLELRGTPLTIDASGVERIGVQCVQVLVAALRGWQKDGVSVSVSEPSDAFDKTLKLIGIDIDQMLQKEMQK